MSKKIAVDREWSVKHILKNLHECTNEDLEMILEMIDTRVDVEYKVMDEEYYE